VPNSKLLINCTHGSHRETARKILAEAGVNPNRLAFAESRNEEYFRCYNQIDIALDPFPFGGGTTTCDALWMGVPVVTLSGNTAVGRGGRSILSNMGLLELIASTPNEYVQIAVDLAGRLDRMDSLRRGMRARLQGSPLMDARQFARDMESAYRQMWRIWCQRPLATV
jgi:predicted O-linked N-acetylglucosamine transferase (SPINDLY family)